MKPKLDQDVRLSRLDNWHECYWLRGDLHYNDHNATADVYLKCAASAVAAAIVDAPHEWVLHWEGLNYTVVNALRYPVTDDVIVVTVDMPAYSFDKTLPIPAPEPGAQRTGAFVTVETDRGTHINLEEKAWEDSREDAIRNEVASAIAGR